MSTMDWDDIRYFLAVARAEQFSGAAARLGVDTGTVARRINALEKSLMLACSTGDIQAAF